jgi:hypothetical protein
VVEPSPPVEAAPPAELAEPEPVEAAPPTRHAPPRPSVSRRPASDPRWTAEIIWREAADRGVFQVLARNAEGQPTIIAQSPNLPWPPRGPESLGDLGRAVDALSAGMREAGWTAMPRGDSWYSLRFGWTSASSPVAPQQRPSDPRTPSAARSQPMAAAPARTGVAPREWPADTAELVRCQIAWASGYRSSRFEAVVYEPGRRRGQAIGGSEPFAWMLKGEPEWQNQQHVAAVKRLCVQLMADGWEDVGRGPEWYARRFVWRADAPAPDRIGTDGSEPSGD